jgi:RNA polymerase sigma-70 factor (ECF subfamily)
LFTADQQMEPVVPENFTYLFQEASPAILAWSRLRLAGSGLEAEDILQEVWLRGSKEFPRYDPRRGSFRAWIFQVAKYTLLDALRERASPARARGEGTGLSSTRRSRAHLAGLPEQVTTFTRRLARDEALEKLLDELAKLEDNEKELVVICGLEGRSTTDAARLLGITQEASRKQWQRLRQRLGQNPRILALIEP